MAKTVTVKTGIKVARYGEQESKAFDIPAADLLDDSPIDIYYFMSSENVPMVRMTKAHFHRFVNELASAIGRLTLATEATLSRKRKLTKRSRT